MTQRAWLLLNNTSPWPVTNFVVKLDGDSGTTDPTDDGIPELPISFAIGTLPPGNWAAYIEVPFYCDAPTLSVAIAFTDSMGTIGTAAKVRRWQRRPTIPTTC